MSESPEPVEIFDVPWPFHVLIKGERFQVHRADLEIPQPTLYRTGFRDPNDWYYRYPNEIRLGIYYDPPKPEFPPGIGDNVVLGEN